MLQVSILWKKSLIVLISLTIIFIHCRRQSNATTDEPNVSAFKPEHVIVIWFENKAFDSIIGNKNAAYINSLLSQGTLFTNTVAIMHPSYPNYIGFFSGSTQGVSSDDCIEGKPYNYPNLWSELQAVGKTFAWYSEDMPTTGYQGCSEGLYVERHNPATIFQNVPDSINKVFSDFNWLDTAKTNMAKLESVVCITPNKINDMHDGSVEDGDRWLKKRLSPVIEWCRNNNSILVITFDESDDENDNRIPVIALGQHVKESFQSDVRYDHYNWTKTICRYHDAQSDWNSDLSSRSQIQLIYR